MDLKNEHEKMLEPEARKAIDCCEKKDAVMLMMIDGFRTIEESICLLAMLWYARKKKVVVHIVPPLKKIQKKSKIRGAKTKTKKAH